MLKVLPALRSICNQNQLITGPENSMSEKQHSESFCDTSRSEHREPPRSSSRDRRYGGRSSAEDPAISTTRSSKRVQSNSRDHPRAEVGGGSSAPRDHSRTEVGGSSSAPRDHPRTEVGGSSSASRDHPRTEVGGSSSASRDHPRAEVGGSSSAPRDHPRTEVGGSSSASRDHPRAEVGGSSSAPRDHPRTEVGGSSSAPRDHPRAEVGGSSSAPRDHPRTEGGGSGSTRDHLRTEVGGGGGSGSTSRDYLRSEMGGGGGNSSITRDHSRTDAGGGGSGSTSRDNPRAEVGGESGSLSSSRSKHGEHGQLNHSTSSGKSHSTKRRRPSEVEEEESECVWTEHASSQGKVYYYNKTLDKSQWEKPAGIIKRAKEDTVPSDPTKYSTPVSKGSIKEEPTKPASTPHQKHPHHHTPASKRSTQQESGHRGRHGDKPYGRGDRAHGHRNQVSPKDRGVSSHHSSPRSRRSTSRSGSGSHSASRGMSGSIHSTPTANRTGASSSLATPPSLSARSATPLSAMTPVFATSHQLTPHTSHQLTPHTPDHTTMLLQQYTSGLGDGATLLQVATTPQNSHHYGHMQPSRTKLTYSPSNGPFLDHHHHHPGTPVPSSSIGYIVQQQSPIVMGVATLQQATPMNLQHGTPVIMHQGTPMLMQQPNPATTMDSLGGLHPLQKALLLQNFSQVGSGSSWPASSYHQHPQGYGVSGDPMSPLAIKLLGSQVTGNSPGTPHIITAVPSYFTSHQGSHPSSPLPHSPMNNASGAVYVAAVSSSPAPTTYFIAPSAGFVALEPAASGGGGTAPSLPPSSSSPWTQLPVSRLNLEGRRGSYPDPGALPAVPQHSQGAELFSRVLAEPWLSHNDPLMKQLDNACHDSLSKRVGDAVYHSTVVLQCQLRRDTVRLKSSSIEERLKSLRSLAKELDDSRSS